MTAAAATKAPPKITPVRGRRRRADASMGAPSPAVLSSTGRRFRGHLVRRKRRFPPAIIHNPSRPVAAAAAPSTVPLCEASVSAAPSMFTPRRVSLSVAVPVVVSTPLEDVGGTAVEVLEGEGVAVVLVLADGDADGVLEADAEGIFAGAAEVDADAEGVLEGEGEGDAEALALGEGATAAQPGAVKTFVSSDTCPFRARALP